MNNAEINSKEQFTQIIEAPKRLFNINFHELWQFRELFGFLLWRDIKVKYKQTFLGAVWAILLPLFQMVLFTVIFGRFAKLPTNGLSPQLFYYSGLIPWMLFSAALSMSANSLVSSAVLLRKIYVPRLIIPAASSMVPFVDFAIASVFLLIMMFYYNITISLSVLLLPLLILTAYFTALGAGLFLSALNVRFRDVRYIVPYILQVWMYLSVIFPYSAIKNYLGDWHWIYGLNPMGGVIEGFRWALLHNDMSVAASGDRTSVPVEMPVELMLTGLAVTALLIFVGLYYFKKTEKDFADIV